MHFGYILFSSFWVGAKEWKYLLALIGFAGMIPSILRHQKNCFLYPTDNL